MFPFISLSFSIQGEFLLRGGLSHLSFDDLSSSSQSIQYFGSGIYFSFYSDYAMWYSEERDSSQILLCKLLTGKTFKCVGRMDGKPCLDGYDSHFSPKGNEIVMFASAGCLPRYIIKFTKQDEQEREQED